MFQILSSVCRDEVYSIQHYVIKFVSYLRQVGGFSLCAPVSSTNKAGHHDITEILLKVTLNINTLTYMCKYLDSNLND